VIKNLKILIAEDDATSEMLISTAMKMFDAKVIKVRTGIEAVETCQKNPDIELVLMDIKMPEMDGYTATRHIRQFNKNVVIIAQTSYALSGDREKALAAGCDDYISKPIDLKKLIALIEKHIKE
jgi:CheY-like chemotaxis protein